MPAPATASTTVRLALLSTVPMLGAALGAAGDELLRQGFTTWRSACRGLGLRLPVLVDFTLQLLPLAVIGLMAGGLVVLLAGIGSPRHLGRASLAAHLGCAVSMPVALVLCALLPPMWMLAADFVLAALAACLVFLLLRKPSNAAGLHP